MEDAPIFEDGDVASMVFFISIALGVTIFVTASTIVNKL